MKQLIPLEIFQSLAKQGEEKQNYTYKRFIILGIFAGAYVAFAGIAANIASFNLIQNPNTFGIGRLVFGMVFTAALIMIVLAGAELFTGNTMVLTCARLEKKICFSKVLKILLVVYLANFLGSVIVALLTFYSGIFSGSNGLLGAMTIKLAYNKVSMGFGQALASGILCNWMVCIAVWISAGADSTIGKIGGIIPPIMVFATGGFDHSVANMYFLSAGLLAKGNPAFAGACDLSQKQLETLNWQSILFDNLLPVSIGNIVAGALLVAVGYWAALKTNKS